MMTVTSQRLTLGDRARVAVAVATVWEAPDRPRPVDAAITAALPDPAGWAAVLGPVERRDLHGRVVTQALRGDEAVVREVARGPQEGWVRVVLPGQPSCRDPAGYPGWVRSEHLTAWEPAPAGDARVVADRCAGGPPPLSYGTALVDAGGRLLDALGSPVDVPADAVAVPGTGSGAELVAAAEAFLGLAYLWGGASGWGVDCSGLVLLAGRRAGLALPRDAADQAAAGTPVPQPDLRAGDLVFFGPPGGTIAHVGIALDPETMLHAPGTGGRVERAVIGRVHPGNLAGFARYG